MKAQRRQPAIASPEQVEKAPSGKQDWMMQMRTI
jgi:hypothetical protein